jgi:transposase-like protein
MDFPIAEFMDEDACYEKLVAVLHPDGLACPRCQARDGLRVHRRHRAPVLDYRCDACGRVFNAFTGTTFHKTHRRPSEILLILRGIAQGETTARLARELNRHRQHLLKLRHRLQDQALKAADPLPLDDEAVEADEMYQNAGEKRRPAPRPRRPSAAPRQPAAGARRDGQRPAAGRRSRRPGVGAAAAPRR